MPELFKGEHRLAERRSAAWYPGAAGRSSGGRRGGRSVRQSTTKEIFRPKPFSWPCVRFSTPDHPITPEEIRRLAFEARQVLDDPAARIPVSERLDIICRWAERWRHARSPWRRRADQMLSESTRLSKPMVNTCLNIFFRSIKRDVLEKLVYSHSGGPRQLVGHVLPANVLAASAESLLVAVIVGHVNLAKVSSRAPLFPLLITETLSEEDARMAQMITLLSWKGGEAELDEVLVTSVDRVMAYGSGYAVDRISDLTPEHVELEVFGPGASIGIVTASGVDGKNMAGLAWRAAIDASLYDQRGCLSLRTVFVEEGKDFSPMEFARALAGAMEGVARRYPPGEFTVAEAAAVRSKRKFWEVRRLLATSVSQWADPHYRWTVLYDMPLVLDEPMIGRVVTVRPFSRLDELEHLVGKHKGKIQGIAVSDARLLNFWRGRGIPRVALFGSLQFTTLGWQREIG